MKKEEKCASHGENKAESVGVTLVSSQKDFLEDPVERA